MVYLFFTRLRIRQRELHSQWLAAPLLLLLLVSIWVCPSSVGIWFGDNLTGLAGASSSAQSGSIINGQQAHRLLVGNSFDLSRWWSLLVEEAELKIFMMMAELLDRIASTTNALSQAPDYTQRDFEPSWTGRNTISQIVSVGLSSPWIQF